MCNQFEPHLLEWIKSIRRIDEEIAIQRAIRRNDHYKVVKSEKKHASSTQNFPRIETSDHIVAGALGQPLNGNSNRWFRIDAMEHTSPNPTTKRTG